MGLAVVPPTGTGAGVAVGVGLAYPVTTPTGTFVISSGATVDPSGPGVGVGNPFGPGIQEGTLQHCGSLGSATRIQFCGTLSYLLHLKIKGMI